MKRSSPLRRSPMKRGAPKRRRPPEAKTVKMSHEEQVTLYRKLRDEMTGRAFDNANRIAREMKRGAKAKQARMLHEVDWSALPKIRKPLRKVGAVAKREKAAVVSFRERLMERAQGYCERCACQVGTWRLEPHHTVKRSRCVGWPDRHNPEINGAAVCGGCHSSLSADPLDHGGPLEGRSRAAHAAFENWRADCRDFSVDKVRKIPYLGR